MKVKITFELDIQDMDECAKMNKIIAAAREAGVTTAETAAKPAPAKAAPAAAPTKPAPAPAPAPTAPSKPVSAAPSAATPKAPAAGSAIKFVDVQAKALECISPVNGQVNPLRAATAELLQKYGATGLSKLAPERYQDFYNDLVALQANAQ
jgi:hypothetical protein